MKTLSQISKVKFRTMIVRKVTTKIIQENDDYNENIIVTAVKSV